MREVDGPDQDASSLESEAEALVSICSADKLGQVPRSCLRLEEYANTAKLSGAHGQ